MGRGSDEQLEGVEEDDEGVGGLLCMAEEEGLAGRGGEREKAEGRTRERSLTKPRSRNGL